MNGIIIDDVSHIPVKNCISYFCLGCTAIHILSNERKWYFYRYYHISLLNFQYIK